MLITVLSKGTGLVREIVLSYFFGASALSDALLVSITIPYTIGGLVAAGIANSYMPIYVTVTKEKGKEGGDRFTSNLLNTAFILSTVLFVLAQIFAPQLIRIFASGFDDRAFRIALMFTRFSLINIYTYILAEVVSGYLNANGVFRVTASVGLVLNGFYIIAMVLGAKVDLTLFAIGSAMAYVLQYVIFIPALRSLRYRHTLLLQPKDPAIKSLMQASIPVLIGTTVDDINQIIDKTLATRIILGGMTAINYAQRLTGFVSGIVVNSLAVVAFPKFSQMASEKDYTNLSNAVVEALDLSNLLMIPSAVGLMVLSGPIVDFVYKRGQFDDLALQMTALSLLLYAPTVVGYGLKVIINRGFYALKDTRTPMIVSTAMVGLNILLDLTLAPIIGLGGLTVSTSIASVGGGLILLYIIARRVETLNLRRMVQSTLQILGAALVMGAVAWGVQNLVQGIASKAIALLLAIGAAIIVYLFMLILLKVEVATDLIHDIIEKIKTKRQ